MGRTVDRGEDYVVDMVIEVDSRGIDVDAVARTVVLPGVEILRTGGRGMIWLTALVTADGEAAAIALVNDAVHACLSGSARVVVSTVVCSAPLGDLYARLDGVLSDGELDRLDLFELVEACMWDHPGHRGRRLLDTSLGSTA